MMSIGAHAPSYRPIKDYYFFDFSQFFGLNVPLFGISVKDITNILLAITTISISLYISIYVKHEGILAAITQTSYLPLMLLSGVMLPISIAPDWIKNIVTLNHFYYLQNASRCLFAGDYRDIIILQSFFIKIICRSISLWLAIHALKKRAS